MSTSTKVALASISNFLKVCADSAKNLRESSHLGAGTKAHLINSERMIREIGVSLNALAAVVDQDVKIPENATSTELKHIKEQQEQIENGNIQSEDTHFLSEREEEELGKKMQEMLGLNLSPMEG